MAYAREGGGMSKRSQLPQSRHHVMIFDEDWQWLDLAFGKYSRSRLGPGVAIRQIVHRHVRQLRQVEDQRVQAQTQEEELVDASDD
jgi:hypothetical protein